MSKHKRLTHNQKIIKALEKIKTPIVDELRNLSIFLKRGHEATRPEWNM